MFLLGAPRASAVGSLRILGSEGKVCWTFAASVAHKTAAQIGSGAPGTTSMPVLRLGTAYRPSGCVAASAVIRAGLVKYPLAYYVSVNGGV